MYHEETLIWGNCRDSYLIEIYSGDFYWNFQSEFPFSLPLNFPFAGNSLKARPPSKRHYPYFGLIQINFELHFNRTWWRTYGDRWPGLLLGIGGILAVKGRETKCLQRNDSKTNDTKWQRHLPSIFNFSETSRPPTSCVAKICT